MTGSYLEMVATGASGVVAIMLDYRGDMMLNEASRIRLR